MCQNLKFSNFRQHDFILLSKFTSNMNILGFVPTLHWFFPLKIWLCHRRINRLWKDFKQAEWIPYYQHVPICIYISKPPSSWVWCDTEISFRERTGSQQKNVRTHLFDKRVVRTLPFRKLNKGLKQFKKKHHLKILKNK